MPKIFFGFYVADGFYVIIKPKRKVRHMDSYVGTKIIKARLATLAEYKRLKYGDKAQILDGDEDAKCYIVFYPSIGSDALYISMSPVDVFEMAYRKIDAAEIRLINGLDDGK